MGTGLLSPPVDYRRSYSKQGLSRQLYEMLFKTIIFAFLATVALADPIVDPRHAQLREMLLQQCRNNGAEDKVTDIENGVKAFAECVQGLVNYETLRQEIEEAKPHGALDEVFKKYCAKTPQLKTCIHTLLDTVSPCVDPNAREHFASAKTGSDQLLDFICYKDGDRIALFIAEGGPSCLQSKASELQQCANDIKASVSTVDAAKALTLAEKCAKFDQLTKCVVTKLETCEKSTPANMAESLFKYVRKTSPCKDIAQV